MTTPTNQNMPDILFYQNPLPMWIYDINSMAFLEVNDAAVQIYGYSRTEFLRMTIAKIRPSEDVDRLFHFISGKRPSRLNAGVWRHITKSGKLLYVKIISHAYQHQGREARLVCAIDVTAQTHAELEIAHALERAKRHTVQLQRVNRLAQRLTIGMHQSELLQELTEEARQIVGAHQAVISFTKNSNWAQSINAVSLSHKYHAYRDFDQPPTGSGIYRLVCSTNQPMRLTHEQLINHPAWRNFGEAAANHPPMNGWLAAPLVDRQGKNIGLIQLSDKLDGEFDDDDEAILSQLAHMASSMLDNTHLFSALQAAEAGVSKLYRLNRELTRLSDRQTVLQTVIDQAREIVGAQWSVFVFVNTIAHDNAIHDFAVSGFSGDMRAAMQSLKGPTQLDHQVFVEHKTMRISDIRQLDAHSRGNLIAFAQGHNLNLRSFMAVPVISDSGASLGALYFGSDKTGAFELQHQQLAEAIAANSGIALEKLLLQHEIQRHATTLESRVAERTAQLERINSELEAFTYSVSHDLRAPLRAIDGFSQILLDKYAGTLDETGVHYLSRIRAGTQRMGSLIDDLLELSRVNRKELTRTKVDLTQLAHTIIIELRQSAPAREVAVKIADNLIAQGDEQLLSIVLHNLLENAWKFTTKTPQAVIEFVQEHTPHGATAFKISDNGAGFSMDYADKLFGVFQRLHQADEYPGTGVGLATVQRIVRRHGGDIWASGKPNQGATFWFTLQNDISAVTEGDDHS